MKLSKTMINHWGRLAALAVGLVLAGQADAASTYYWIGGGTLTDGAYSWTDGANWSLSEGGEAANEYPTKNDWSSNAKFPAGTTVTITLNTCSSGSSFAHVGNLDIGYGAVVTFVKGTESTISVKGVSEGQVTGSGKIVLGDGVSLTCHIGAISVAPTIEVVNGTSASIAAGAGTVTLNGAIIGAGTLNCPAASNANHVDFSNADLSGFTGTIVITPPATVTADTVLLTTAGDSSSVNVTMTGYTLKGTYDGSSATTWKAKGDISNLVTVWSQDFEDIRADIKDGFALGSVNNDLLGSSTSDSPLAKRYNTGYTEIDSSFFYRNTRINYDGEASNFAQIGAGYNGRTAYAKMLYTFPTEVTSEKYYELSFDWYACGYGQIGLVLIDSNGNALLTVKVPAGKNEEGEATLYGSNSSQIKLLNTMNTPERTQHDINKDNGSYWYHFSLKSTGKDADGVKLSISRANGTVILSEYTLSETAEVVAKIFFDINSGATYYNYNCIDNLELKAPKSIGKPLPPSISVDKNENISKFALTASSSDTTYMFYRLGSVIDTWTQYESDVSVPCSTNVYYYETVGGVSSSTNCTYVISNLAAIKLATPEVYRRGLDTIHISASQKDVIGHPTPELHASNASGEEVTATGSDAYIDMANIDRNGNVTVWAENDDYADSDSIVYTRVGPSVAGYAVDYEYDCVANSLANLGKGLAWSGGDVVTVNGISYRQLQIGSGGTSIGTKLQFKDISKDNNTRWMNGGYKGFYGNTTNSGYPMGLLLQNLEAGQIVYVNASSIGTATGVYVDANDETQTETLTATYSTTYEAYYTIQHDGSFTLAMSPGASLYAVRVWAPATAQVNGTGYLTVQDAVDAVTSSAATVTVIGETDETALTIPEGKAITLVDSNNYFSGTVSVSAEGYVLGTTTDSSGNTVYTAISTSTEETWIGDANGADWQNASNWDKGFVPVAATPVKFGSGSYKVYVSNNNWDNNAVNREKCAAMTVNGNVTITHSTGEWCYLSIHGDISGTGSLTVKRAGLDNCKGSQIAVACEFYVATPTNSGEDSYLNNDNGFSFSGTVGIYGLLQNNGNTEITGKTTFGSGAVIRSGYTRGNEFVPQQFTFNEVEILSGTEVEFTGGSYTFSGIVTLNSGATLTIPTGSNVGGATFATSIPGHKVTSSEDSAIVYSVIEDTTGVSPSTDKPLAATTEEAATTEAATYLPVLTSAQVAQGLLSSYYTCKAVEKDGTWYVSAVLADSVSPVVDDGVNAPTVTASQVTLKVEEGSLKRGLYYGIGTKTSVDGAVTYGAMTKYTGSNADAFDFTAALPENGVLYYTIEASDTDLSPATP